MKKSQTYSILLLLLILAAGLQFLAATQTSFWLDEAWTAQSLQKEPGSLDTVVARDIHPPLLMYSLSAWGNIFGFEELGLRSFSILCVCFAVLVTFKFSDELFDEKTALITVAVLVFSPLFIMFGHNARYYSMAMLLTLLATYATYKFLTSKQIIFIVIYLLSSIAMLYLVLGTLAVILACNLWFLFAILRKDTRSLKTFFLWIAAQVLIGISYLPGLQLFSSDAAQYTAPGIFGNWLAEIVKRVAYLGFTFSLGETLSPLNPLAWVGAILIVIIALFAILSGRKDSNFWMPILCLFVIGASSVAISLYGDIFIQTWQNLPRWAFFGLPFLTMWLGYGLAKMKPTLGALAGLALLIVYSAGIFNYFTGRQFLQPIYAVPWRTIFADIQSEAQPQTLILCNGNSEQTACRYYGERFGYTLLRPKDWNDLDADQFDEVWWIQVNMGTRATSESSLQILAGIGDYYPESSVKNYALHDPSIRWLKAKLGQLEDYEYRINLYRFTAP